MVHNIKVTKDSLYKAILMLFNFKLKLTTLEIDILSELLKNDINIVDTETRALLRKNLKMSKFTCNNYIINLKNKNMLVSGITKDDLIINPYVVDVVKHKEQHFNFDTID